MRNWQIKLSLFLNYFVFAILLNSVGTLILQVQRNFGVSEGSASVLEAFKDLSIAAVSFILSSYITRIGYKKAMLFALGFVLLGCFLLPSLPSFWATKLMFALVGSSFALIKMSVYGTIGLITADKKEHISLMSFLESFFMVGVLAGSFIFSFFMDDQNPTSLAWMQVYYWLGAIVAVAFVLLLTAPLDETPISEPASAVAAQDFGQMFKLMAIPLVLVFIICAFFYVLVEQSIMSWLPSYNNKVLLLPASLSTQMAGIMAGATAVGRFFTGILLKKFHWYSVLTTCVLLAGGLVLVAVPLGSESVGRVVTGWGDAPAAAFIFPLIGLFLASIYPVINSLILTTLPVQKHGLMAGLIIVFSALGGTTGSILTGNIFQHFGGQTAFYFSLFPISILLVGLYFFKKLQTKVA